MTKLNTIVNGKAYRFEDAHAAAQLGNGLTFFGSAEELASADVKTSDLIAVYNSLAEKPVNKFADRKTAATRTWAVIIDKVPVTEKKVYNMSDVNTAVADAATKTKLTAEEKKTQAEAKAAQKANEKANKAAEKAEAKKVKEAAAAAKKAEGGAAAGRGRVSSLSGKVLKHLITKDAEGTIKNPRKAGSHGWNSLKIIIDAGDAGISTEGYIAAGGRMNDLHWDIDHGNVVAADAVAAPASGQTTTA